MTRLRLILFAIATFPELNGPPQLIGPIVNAANDQFYFECVVDYDETPDALHNVTFLFSSVDSGVTPTVLQYPNKVARIYGSDLQSTQVSKLICITYFKQKYFP